MSHSPRKINNLNQYGDEVDEFAEISVGKYWARTNFLSWGGGVRVSLGQEHIVPAIHEIFNDQLIGKDDYHDVLMVEIKNEEAE